MYIQYSNRFINKVTKINTYLEQRTPLFFGYNIELKLGDYIHSYHSRNPIDKIFLLTDHPVAKRYAPEIVNQLQQISHDVDIIILPQGEQCKSMQDLTHYCEDLINKGVTKSSLIVALGGGAVGNLAGMIAGLVFNGIRFIEIPTTMSHQTDSTLSNKQAINGQSGKNHFGFYYAPLFIWTDTKYLITEPLRLKQAGIIKGIKNALIDQAKLVPYLKKHLKPNGDYSPAELTDLCYQIIQSKIAILKQDPSEKSYGIIVEYGHTFAHAIEWLAKGQLIHGEAVAIGMKMAAEVALCLHYIDQDLYQLHYQLIDNCLQMSPALPIEIQAEHIITAIENNNKELGASIHYVLLDRLGGCKAGQGNYLVEVDKILVAKILTTFIKNYNQYPAKQAG